MLRLFYINQVVDVLIDWSVDRLIKLMCPCVISVAALVAWPVS